MNKMNEEFLVLPKIVKVESEAKLKQVTYPDISMFNKEQLEIFNRITSLKVGEFSQTLLTGYSGTGKSFLVSKIIEAIVSKNKGANIGITAPTNKAVRVLKNLSSICETHGQVSFNTLHSLLGLKRIITHEGKEEYKPEYKFDDEFEFQVIFVDEVSMLENHIYHLLIEKAKLYDIMLVFIGDRGQIPPVNGGESILFTKNIDNNFNLVDIIRQASGNPIITLAQQVRTNTIFLEETNVDENNNGVIFLKINTETPLLERYFKSENFSENHNFVKVLAWTNKAVDYYNDKIRKIIYGDDCGLLCVGEKMVTNKPILDSKKKVILNNNDEFEVISFGLKTEFREPKFSYYSVNIKVHGKRETIKILAEKSQDDYQKELKRLKDVAKNINGKAWSKYYAFLEKYADVKYNYALTVHKSQGSTFDNAIVINCDIKRIRDNNEKNKLLYTAITRAKNKLFLI
jgi:exodeoxyribonuclease-5